MSFEPIPYATPLSRPQIENDRRTWLLLFGIVSILIGLLPGMILVGATVFMFVVLTQGDAESKELLEGLYGTAVYMAATTLFIWAGIASIRRKRWVRPVAISVGWIALLGSILILGAIVPALIGRLFASGGQVDTVIEIVGFAIAIGAGVVAPAAFIWFFSTNAVKRTLDAYDPGRSWTERCPLPVFIACTGLLFTGVATIGTAFEELVPFFGLYVKGDGAIALSIGAGLFMLLAAVLMYRMRELGLWIGFLVIVLGFSSALATFHAAGIEELYRQMNLRPSETMLLLRGTTPVVLAWITGLICVGYLLWLHGYLRRHAKLVEQ